VQEFGPVTWGAYDVATAGVRSLTDEMHFGALRDMPADRLSDVAKFWRTFEETTADEECDHKRGVTDPDAPGLCDDCRALARTKTGGSKGDEPEPTVEEVPTSDVVAEDAPADEEAGEETAPSEDAEADAEDSERREQDDLAEPDSKSTRKASVYPLRET